MPHGGLAFVATLVSGEAFFRFHSFERRSFARISWQR